MSKSDDYLFKGVNILAWIIFIGVCIDAGGVITNAFYSIFFNARFSTHFWGGIDLYNVYNFNEAIFVTLHINEYHYFFKSHHVLFNR